MGGDHTLFGIIGTITGAIGVTLSVYFYITTTETRDLIYSVDSTKTAVVRTGQSSKIEVQVNGTPITQDVTAAQIVIWNNGKKSIRRENILGPSASLFIETGTEHPIIEAKVLKVSRNEIVNPEVDDSTINKGQLRVVWKILEKNDGILLQLIYFGNEKTPINALATIEQQGEIRTVSHKGRTYKLSILDFFPLLLAFMIIGGVISVWRQVRKSDLPTTRIDTGMFTFFMLIGIAMVALCVYFIFQLDMQPTPLSANMSETPGPL